MKSLQPTPVPSRVRFVLILTSIFLLFATVGLVGQNTTPAQTQSGTTQNQPTQNQSTQDQSTQSQSAQDQSSSGGQPQSGDTADNENGAAPQDTLADRIIAILRESPDVMSTVKDEVAQRTSVDPMTVTDAMVFSRIRTDASVRDAIAEELTAQG